MPKLTLYEHAVRAVVYAESPEKQAQVEDELKQSPLAKKIIMRKGYSAIYHHARGVQRLLGTPYQARGRELVGLGRNSTVIRIGGEVIKIARASGTMSVLERNNLIDELNRRHSIARQYLGSICLDQHFETIRHPLRNREVAASRQQYIDFRPLNGYELVVAANEHDELVEFAQRALAMDREAGLVCDMSGTDNIGFDQNGHLVLVDTVPLCARDATPSVDRARTLIAELARQA